MTRDAGGPDTQITLAGRYRLESSIAIGGMGEVWQARDLLLERDVAIKVLKAEYLSDPGFLERFRAEARHAAGLSHPGIATVYDYGEIDEAPFLVMELVAGEPLSAILARTGALPIAQALDIAAQTARALGHAHAAGVVHRDVKPGNILISPDGTVKVTDFGIARAIDGVSLTQTGTVFGTANYLSPEQASGTPCVPASDLYSLGVVTYEMVAGFRPFTATNPVAVALAHVRDVPESLPADVPPQVRALVMRALDKDVTRRYTDAGAFAAAAEQAAATSAADVATTRALRAAGAAALTVAAGAAVAATGDEATAAVPAAAVDQTRALPLADATPTPTPKTTAATATATAGAVMASLRRWPLRWAAGAVIALLLVAAMAAEARSPDHPKQVASKAPATKSSARATASRAITNTPAASQAAASQAATRPAVASSAASSSAAPSLSLVVPVDLIGKNYDQAAAAVRLAGLTPEYRETKDGGPAGTIIEVQPDPGTRLEPGAVVTLWTSSDRGHGKKKDGGGD